MPAGLQRAAVSALRTPRWRRTVALLMAVVIGGLGLAFAAWRVSLDVALHGAEAVAHVRRRAERGGKLYDLILMDSMMPVMDGATATREIRAMESAYRSSKTGDELRDAGNARPMIIVGLSAEGGPGYEQEARDAGMDGTLGKPCRPETMRKTLKEVHRGEWKRGTFQSASKRASLHF